MEKRPDRGGRERLAPKDQQEKEGFHDILPFIPPRLFCPGEHLRICPQEYTCCSSEIEQRLTWETESIFRSLVEESGSFLVHTLDVRHRKFDGEDLGSPNLASPFCAHDPRKHPVPIPCSIPKAPQPWLSPHPIPGSLQGPVPSPSTPHQFQSAQGSESCSISNSPIFSLPIPISFCLCPFTSHPSLA